MLQTIRERLTGWVAVAVIVIIGLALAISFGNVDTGVGTAGAVAQVNGEEIPLNEFRTVYQAQLLRQQEILQGGMPPGLEQQLKRNVLEALVNNRVLSQYVRAQGYRVDDQALAAFIRGVPAFQVGGEFSQPAYVSTLASQGITPEAFERDQRAALEIGQLESGVVASSFYTPTEYRRFIELQLEEREVTLARFQPGDFLDKIELEPGRARSVYDAEPERFQTEESVTIEYVDVKLEDIAAAIDVDEASLREVYDAEPDRFRSAEEREARHILIAVEDEADEAARAELATDLSARLGEGADFAALAREYSDDPGSAPDGGELGWAGRGVYVPAFEDALFGLAPGEVSDPVRTEFGYHIIELKAVREGSVQPFEAVREELLEEVQRREAEDRFYGLAERMDDAALENPGSLAPVAEATGLELKRAERITRSGGLPFGFSQPLVEAAFSVPVLDEGENSPLIEVDEGHAVVLRVVEHRLPEPRPFEEVEAALVEDLTLEAAAARATELGEALLARAEAGESLEALAEEFGIELAAGTRLERQSRDFPPAIVGAVFRAPRPGDEGPVIGGVATGRGGFAVYRLDEVRPGRPESVPRDQRDQRKALLAQQLGNNALVALIRELRESATVAVAEDVIDGPEEF